jgi:hypothetical protein
MHAFCLWGLLLLLLPMLLDKKGEINASAKFYRAPAFKTEFCEQIGSMDFL